MKILLIGYGAMNERVARLAERKGHEIVGVIVRIAIIHIPTLLLNILLMHKMQM